VNTLKLNNCSREQFISAITSEKGDNFAKTFVAKADMQEQWDHCIGLFDGDELCGAIITTISKRAPPTANLQLLHTFVQHRGKGVAKILCLDSLKSARANGAKYFRVSSEIPAISFYEKIGFKFWGKQKSGCQLSIFKIVDDNFTNGDYDYSDSVIYNAINKKGKGGCVEIFDLKNFKEVLDLERFF
jgi:GNAT superfamily N-acetyltransferase